MEEDEIFENEMAMDSVEANAIEDMDEDNYSDPLSGTVVGLVQDHYTKASTARENEEKRWVQAYRNYRGLYGQMSSLLLQRSLGYLSKLLRLKY